MLTKLTTLAEFEQPSIMLTAVSISNEKAASRITLLLLRAKSDVDARDREGEGRVRGGCARNVCEVKGEGRVCEVEGEGRVCEVEGSHNIMKNILHLTHPGVASRSSGDTALHFAVRAQAAELSLYVVEVAVVVVVMVIVVE